MSSTNGAIKSLVPARMDRLPWTRFHWSVVVGLGVSWILDGLEIQIVSNAGFQADLNLSTQQVTSLGTIYLVGQVVGALVFGRMSDRLGRRKLFILTLAIYLIGSGVAGLAQDFWFLAAFRFVAGLGIGGEYAAINSAIDELIPAKYRGHVDIAINGTYWGGAALGAFANIYLLDTANFSESIGWRIGFFLGPVLGIAIIFLRRHIPESPRWLMTHGREEEAEATVTQIEEAVEKSTGKRLPDVDESKAMTVTPTDRVGFLTIARVLLKQYPTRTLVGASMMITQAFLYNAIFFTYALVLTNFFGLKTAQTSIYFFPFAIGNLLGPIILGRFFDTWGRRQMIFLTYLVSGLVLATSAFLFRADAISATVQVAFWCVSFFFASAGASSAYLTVSEIFPLELRSQAISYFFALAQVFGAVAPLIYGAFIGDGSSREPLFWGYLLGSAVMIGGGVIALVFGVDAARKGLEDVTQPLSVLTGDAEQQRR
ncbi:putative MFS family arabinose efflux permease [Curtobacterium sp. PhB142]|uniref:MFS transporter n=1 Tax=unclassified Curtobacterium TaxID=257496 RepID=UPI000FA7D9CA|nr:MULTISPECIES: MFS transporter [unclassified Curtobacterium]TCL83483.1 putative MFS family arabinose efflux permease [Curtobacterium sp. PhB142]TCM01004.1 putative MFS family arabinose efflux permease [Curtobacterium sp. PhB134]TCU48311.1 putative MFS family arabinose efflux permease [Curtobacterium sp. PhB146]TDW47503.1 putative MFS family arabinose efflux permease [Curtobacterium sp. PhB42]TDW57371.1 putative MFS family arabinose efflux permease [Curtobacterium sp. PhB190]